jgi:predicted TIM-barrel fold metal-dependent hydrolase
VIRPVAARPQPFDSSGPSGAARRGPWLVGWAKMSRMHRGLRVIDSDMHVMEPPDLWQRYIDPAFAGRAPTGSATGPLDLGLVGPDGEPWGRFSGTAGRGQPERRRIETRFDAHHDRGWTAEVQLEAMDIEGVDVAALFPSRGLFVLARPDLDPELGAALARAYNDWLHQFCTADPQRLIGVAMLSPFDVGLAVEEARRARGLGFRAVFLRPNIVHGRNWHDPELDPLWSALEELDLPVGFHEGSGTRLRQVGDHFGDGSLLRHAVCHPLEMMLGVTSFCAGGVLARHPRLRVAFLEGNCGWVPFMLWRLDEHWENFRGIYADPLPEPPSAYFRRQCFVSVEADEAPVRHVVEDTGDGQLVFSTDYPHFDSKFPHALDAFRTLPLGEDAFRHILWDNCARLYGLGAGSAGSTGSTGSAGSAANAEHAAHAAHAESAESAEGVDAVDAGR